MDKVQIRKLQKNDADEISRIYAAITMKPVDPDFKRVVEEHAMCPGNSFTSGTSWVSRDLAAAPHTPLSNEIVRHP